MKRTRFKDTQQNLHFSNLFFQHFSNTEADKKDKGYQVRSLTTHFNESFSKYVSSVDEHMVMLTNS